MLSLLTNLITEKPLSLINQRGLIILSVLISCLTFGCANKVQNDVEELAVAVSECMWSEAHAESPTRISNEWLKDKVLMDFLHTSNLGSEHLLQDMARDRVSGYDTAEEFRLSLIRLANNEQAGETPESSLLEYVPHPNNRDTQGTLLVQYFHLLHCREYWQGHTAVEVSEYDDTLSDLAECYWRTFRIEEPPPSARSSFYVQTAQRTDYVSASQVDAVFRRNVSRFRDMTPDIMADIIKSDSSLCR